MANRGRTNARRKCWILCSSGAHPLYLENVVRTLALPAGEELQYRYEQDIVSDEFRRSVQTGDLSVNSSVTGDTTYLCYLDNRDKAVTPRVYPVREAVILSASLLGTTYVVRMRLRRFVDWAADPALDTTIATIALELLPGWTQPAAIAGNPKRQDSGYAQQKRSATRFCENTPLERDHT